MKMLLLLALLLTLDACQNPSRLQAVQSARPQHCKPSSLLRECLLLAALLRRALMSAARPLSGEVQTLSEHRPQSRV